MFIRLNVPTFVLQGAAVHALPEEVLFNTARIGAVVFGRTVMPLTFVQSGKVIGTVPAGQARTIQIDIDGHLKDLVDHFVERRTVLVFPAAQHGEYERIKRILENRVVES
jgi:hypothetical protein